VLEYVDSPADAMTAIAAHSSTPVTGAASRRNRHGM